LSSAVILPNDVIGYVATARNWIEGRGFVEPIMYSYYLDGASVPLPAIAVRPPIISILFAIPMTLGLGLVGLSIVHALWSAAIGSSIVLLGYRFMSLPAAIAVAIGVAWSPGWLVASTRLLSEATSVGALLVLFAIAPRSLRTPCGGALLALATLLAWLVRPNLGAFVGVVVVAAVLNWGLRDALRSKSLWAYVLTFALLQQSTSWALRAVFGFPPYAHYGVMAETLGMSDVRSYQAEYGGILGFAVAHCSDLLIYLVNNLHSTFEHFFLLPSYLYVGWIGLPGVAYVILRRSQTEFLCVLCGVGGIAFTAIAILSGWGYAGLRYPLLGAVCLWLIGMAACDRALARLAARRVEMNAPVRPGLRALPLVILLIVYVIVIPPTKMGAMGSATSWFEGVLPQLQKGAKSNRVSRSLCEFIREDAIVTSPNPWNIYYWCGNAGYLIPEDLTDLKWLHAYLDEMKPGYIIAERMKDRVLFNRSPRLETLETRGPAVLYAVKHAGTDERVWASSGPLDDLMPPRVGNR
jgi:hypothetical protein